MTSPLVSFALDARALAVTRVPASFALLPNAEGPFTMLRMIPPPSVPYEHWPPAGVEVESPGPGSAPSAAVAFWRVMTEHGAQSFRAIAADGRPSFSCTQSPAERLSARTCPSTRRLEHHPHFAVRI